MSDICEVNEIQPMSDADIKQFVLDYVDQKIFIMQEMNPRDLAGCLHMVFMPLIGIKFSKEARNDVGTIWAYTTDRLPNHMGINGYPIHSAVRLMNKANWERAKAGIIKLEEKRKKEAEDLEV